MALKLDHAEAVLAAAVSGGAVNIIPTGRAVDTSTRGTDLVCITVRVEDTLARSHAGTEL
jgi:hypothetical protein